jgi:hypothetical protein
MRRSRRRTPLPPPPLLFVLLLLLPREPSGTFSPSSSPSLALHQNLCPSLHAELWHSFPQYLAFLQRRHLANCRGYCSHRPHNTAKKRASRHRPSQHKSFYVLLAHCRIPPLLSSLRHALRMMTPAQYWISGGSVGGGFGRSYSCELGRNVNRSTSENTFVWRGDVVDVTRGAAAAGLGAAFSFPLRLANALKNPVLDVGGARDDGPAVCCVVVVVVEACGLLAWRSQGGSWCAAGRTPDGREGTC